MEKIVILPALENKLFDLIFILHDKEYFGFAESAIAYVDKITNIFSFPNMKNRRSV